MQISSSVLRLTWAVIESTTSRDLLLMTDTALIRLLMQRVSSKVLLSGDEVCVLYDYLSSRLVLIRDLADSRAA